MNSSEYLEILRTQKSHISYSMTIGERNMFFLRVFNTNREKCKRVQSLRQSSIKESVLIKDTGPVSRPS